MALIVVFELNMPSSAVGRSWSRHNDVNAIVKTFRSKSDIARAQELLAVGYWRYAFGDGWVASVSMREVYGDEVRKIRRSSKGFAGYEWMVNSIWDFGKIRIGEEL